MSTISPPSWKLYLMKNNKVLLAGLFLCSGIAYAQIKTRNIDSITIKKSLIFHRPHIYSELSKKDLEKSSGDNLANALKSISGITMLQNGGNISKPVIQGLTNQRIAIMNNDVKIESQQWGNDHSPEIDPFLAHHIEVVKGAEAVKYGANALGGVVLLRSEALPYDGKPISGKAQLIGESNGEKWAGNLMLQGNFNKKNPIAWRIQSSGKRAGNYQTPDYYVENTGIRELNYSANIGYQLPHEKFEIFHSFFSTKLGIFQGSRIGSMSDWDIRLEYGRPLDKGSFSYDINLPKQEVKHQITKLKIESDRNFGKFSFIYAYQRNHRQEYDLRIGPFASKPTFDVQLSTHTASLDFEKEHNEYFKNYIGVTGSRQDNYNIPGNGTNSILPNFISNNFGVYLSEKFKKGSWILDAGVRYDYKTFNAAGYNRYGAYYSGKKTFSNLSYNFGLNKSLSRSLSITSNIGLAWRAPEAIELFSNGVHHGSAFYLLGDEKLNLEKGIKWSSKIEYANERLFISADIFLQKIKGFIYEMPTKELKETWSGYFPVFAYKQSDALFKGADLSIKLKALSWLEYSAKASAVYADNLSEDYYFPSISPENLSQSLNFNLSKLTGLSGAYISIEHLWANKQKRFSKEADLIPDSPPAYHLLNLSLGTNISINTKNDMSMSLTATNLLNHLYKDYTDNFRYFVHGVGRNIQFRINYNF